MSANKVSNQPAVGGQELFVGRETELAALRGALGEVCVGVPRLVGVEGPAGIGKTALVDRFLAKNENDLPCVLRASGEEAEASLAFGVLDQLVTAAWAVRPNLAAGMPAPSAPCGERQADPLAAGAGLVDLLGELQDSGPVAVVVDDIHWADLASLQALTFALRRLRVDRVLALMAVRNMADPRLPGGLRRLLTGGGAVRIALAGLDTGELRALSRQFGPRMLSRRAAARLREHTAGNPLHARALLEQLPPGAFDDRNSPIPAPRSYAVLTLTRLAGCRPDTQDLVVAAAVLGMDCTLHQAAELAGLDTPLPALDEAIAEGLLVEQVGDRAVRFPHPLLHAAVYTELGPARRAELHTLAAGVVKDEASRLMHLARAADGPDGQLAADLARVGREEARDGAWAVAAEYLATAARLSPSRANHEQLSLEAVECRLLSGDAADPQALADRLRTFRPSGWRSYLLGRLMYVGGRVDEAEALLVDAWRRCGPDGDPLLRARIAGQLATLHSIYLLRRAEAATWAERALQLAPRGAAADMAQTVWLYGLGMSGRAGVALASVAGLPDPAVASTAELDQLLGRGMLRTWTDDLRGARADLAGVLAASHGRSVMFRLSAAAMLADAEIRMGRWDDAVLHCDLAVSVAADADQPFLASYCHGIAVVVVAARGQWPCVDQHVRAAEAAAATGIPGLVATAAVAKAHRARARHRPDEVVAALEPLLRPGRPDRIGEPVVSGWQVMLVDALVVLGKLDRAEQVLTPFEAVAAEHGHRSVMAMAARTRGNLQAARGDVPGAEQAYQRGLAHADAVDVPFERGLLQLAYGAFLRRAGRRRQAVAQLIAARDVMSRLGATPYLEQCGLELDACGAAAPGGTRDPDDIRERGGARERGSLHLTPRELAVARLAATGLTNRQVARELVVSVKTVEFHVRNVYAKLQVTSRTQLARCLGED